MKKYLLLSALLSSAMAMNAQESVSADFGKIEAYNGKTYLASPVVKSDITYANPVMRAQKAPQAEILVRTMADGVYSQILHWTTLQDGSEGLGAYTADWLYGPALVGWKYFGLAGGDLTGKPSYTYTRKDFSGKDEDMPMEDGKLVIWGTTQYYTEVEGRDEAGLSAKWSRLETVNPSQGEVMLVAESPLFNSQVYFSAAYFGNMYGYYTGFQGGDYVGDGARDAAAVVSIFTAPITPLTVYGGNAVVTAVDGKAAVNVDNMLFEIWTVTEDGQLGEPVAQTGGGEIKGNPASELATVEYSFSEIDGSGLPVLKPVTIPAGKKFAVVVNNIQGSNLKFAFTDDATGGTGNGGGYYLTSAGAMEPINGQEGRTWVDAAIGLKGYMPGGKFLTGDYTSTKAGYLEIPAAGGYASTYDNEFNMVAEEVALFGSSHSLLNEAGETQLNITYPEWVTEVQIDTTDFSTTARFSMSIAADELPSGVSGRQGEVTVDIFGYKASVVIGQGEFNAVSDAQVAEASARVEGENIVLTYGEGVNAVDVINVAGARVASYALPAGGNFTVPASDYAKGLYILNFKGDKKATVKVVK